MSKDKIRIVLPGGGIAGSYQLGLLSEFFKINPDIQVDAVYGTSIGSIISPFVANKKLDIIGNVFSNIKSINDVVEKWTFLGFTVPNWIVLNALYFIFKFGAYKRVKLVDVIEQNLTKDELIVAGEKCHVVAYNYTDDCEVWFNGDELVDGIRCSSAVFMGVPPITLSDKKEYSDGGVTELFPLSYIIEHNEKTNYQGKYLLVDLNTREHNDNTNPKTGIDYLLYLFYAASTRLALIELENFKNYLGDRLIYVKPNKNIFTSGLDINRDKMNEYYSLGVNDAKNIIL
jgi:predicted acylesterase/phospholipase RssA